MLLNIHFEQVFHTGCELVFY